VAKYVYDGMGEIHMGKLLERAIRRKGLNITEIAVALGISRRTIYNWFKLEVIDESIMGKISDVIRHDFSSGKPKTFIIRSKTADSSPLEDDAYWKDKYINLLERYSDLIK
jgi:transcriptional antiterminator